MRTGIDRGPWRQRDIDSGTDGPIFAPGRAVIYFLAGAGGNFLSK